MPTTTTHDNDKNGLAQNKNLIAHRPFLVRFVHWVQRHLRFGLLEAFLLFTFLSFGISLGLDYYTTHTSAHEVEQKLFQEHVSSLSSELNRIQAVVDLLIITSKIELTKTQNPSQDWRTANNLFMPFMKGYPFITSINYGDDAGNGYLILHVENKWKNRIRLGSDPGFVTWLTLNENGEVQSISRLHDEYDPRVRPWYVFAKQEVQWSSPYVFRTTRDLGVTASAHISRSAVLGIDIMLKDLSALLSNLASSKDETLSLVDADGLLWAHSDEKKFSAMLLHSSKVPYITDIEQDEGIRNILERLNNKTPSSNHKKGDHFFIASVPLSFKSSGPVYLLSVTRSSRHTAEFLHIATLKTLILSVLVLLFAGLFIWRYLLPILKITKTIRGYALNDSITPAIMNRKDEIGLLSDELYRMTQEINTRRRALQKSEQEYKRLSAEFRGLLNAIPDTITLQDENYTILWANKTAAAMLHKDPDALVGSHCFELWYNRTTPCPHCPVRESFRTGLPADMAVTMPDGKTWDLRTVPLKDEKDATINVIEIGRDITEHRKLEAQLIQAQKMEAVGILAGGIAHDFNNILTAIIGYANLTQKALKKDDPLFNHIQKILDSSQRAASLTRSLLAFGRKQTMNPVVIDLNEIVTTFQKFLRPILREDIELKIATSEEAIAVFADRAQIEQLLMNLATNARDAMPDGGTIIIKTAKVKPYNDFSATPGSDTLKNYALLSVADTGIGIEKSLHQKIFDPFFTTKEVGKGTGLGLAMVYGIVKKHSGFIDVDSEPGKGATFNIYLPLVQTAEAKAAGMPQIKDVQGGSETVLLAEDDPTLLTLAETVLSNFGYRVITATNGKDAVEKFVRNQKKIRLVILDGIMPQMNGKDAYLKIKALMPDIKAIFMSGYAEDVFTKNGNLMHDVVFLQKPVTPADLAVKVREVLDNY